MLLPADRLLSRIADRLLPRIADRLLPRIMYKFALAAKSKSGPEAMADHTDLLSRSRLEALIDGVFAFAMTLLVVNVTLPEGFAPATGAELARALFNLADTFLAYVITFIVLGGFWIWRAKDEAHSATSGALVWATLMHLFFVTLMPFSMVVIARYSFAPAIWMYSGNMIFLALTAAMIVRIEARDAGRQLRAQNLAGYALLIVTAILSIAIAAFSPDYAMLAYLLNFASPLLTKERIAA